jgi:hypothetical protein
LPVNWDELRPLFHPCVNQTLSTFWQLVFTTHCMDAPRIMASTAANLTTASQRTRLSAGALERMLSALVMLGVLAAVVFGWLHRHDDWINPEHGIGYTLGIIGGSLMIILLAYPLRKRATTKLRATGSIGFWFRFHMLLGLLGPLAVLYHSRFSWGALNSAVALGAMIIVASSGLVGRFFYSRVHRGYSGRKLELRGLKHDMDDMLAGMAVGGLSRQALLEQIQPFEDRAVKAGANFWSSARAVISLGVETRGCERRLAGQLASADARQGLADYFEAVRRAAEFAFYDRLLRLWHLLHLPLFFLLVASAVLHIVAVHMY